MEVIDMKAFNNLRLLLIIPTVFSGSVGCTSLFRREIQTVVVEHEYPKYPEGTVDYVWEEPTRDVVDVPPGLDPEGHYYRPGHQEVVESLPGRYKFYTNE